MKAARKQKEFVTFSPDLRGSDPRANYWMRQVMLRLRREICWCWHERGLQPTHEHTTLPPFTDKVSSTLDMSRFWAEKQDFIVTDPTAGYLTESIRKASLRALSKDTVQGSFGWVVDELDLDEVATFVLALALTAAFDGSVGSVIAACLNDQTKIYPNLALAQRLWDEPDKVLAIADPFHALFRCGLIRFGVPTGHYCAENKWDAPLTTPSLVARQLIFPETPFPQGVTLLGPATNEEDLTDAARVMATRLQATDTELLRVIPVMGAKGASRRETIQAIAAENEKQLVEFDVDPTLLDDPGYLNSIATVSWLKDAFLFLSNELSTSAASEKQRSETSALPAQTIPATVFVAVNEGGQLPRLPANVLLPAIHVPVLTYEERLGIWRESLGGKAESLGPAVAECARRFRFEKETIESVCRGLKALPEKISEHDLTTACRAELSSEIGELASRVAPRFNNEELILPHKQHVLFTEILKAMRSLTEVHYGWGTAQVWNEGGISVLFAGAPGTGKTMAAEILALKLDLPMYRIDLSQIVNKYIGETEKNLKRVFDAADVSDMILFFDEADSLFGRRTEVSDAHDRYANLEISYLLERMERFKGLAILATNRKQDLDEAFLRRLRYIVDFPLPDAAERKRIWRQVIPEHADSSELNFDYLAEQFPLAGGNIRSIVFNACLQCADGSALSGKAKRGRLTMPQVIVSVKREYDKLNRTLSLEQYGAYAAMIKELESNEAKDKY
jgi:hypothetical protein